MPVTRPISPQCAILVAALLLSACQQPKQPEVDEVLHSEPPATGAGNCPALAADWLSRMPTHQRLVEPADCSSATVTPLFAWGEARDRRTGTNYTLTVRRAGGSALFSRNDLAQPRARVSQPLAAGSYEWSVSYTQTAGTVQSTQWRRFTIESMARAMNSSDSGNAPISVAELPDGNSVAIQVAARARPRMLPAGSSFASIRAAALQAENLPALNVIRNRALWTVTQAIPGNPDLAFANAGTNSSAQVTVMRNLVQTARSERFNIENELLVGRIDNNTALVNRAKARLLALAAWSPTGVSSEKSADQANREVFLALAQGLDLFWNELSAAERTQIITPLRARMLQTSEALNLLEREPYDSHGLTNVRMLTQALMLAVGAPGFAEAQSLLARHWEQSLFVHDVFGADGSFGNGIAYTWYNITGTVPYAAAVRVISGVDLYRLASYRRADEQLMAFTAPNWQQASAYGDEMETRNLYDSYGAAYLRLHAQMTRDPIDVWYWRAKPSNVTAPNDATIWQILLLGANSSPLPAPVAPTSNDWFSVDSGLAAMHVDGKRSDRTSVFFRSSRFGAYNHSHADNNGIVYVSQGLPLLINSGYYPYYNSPHHKNTRATRYKNALTYDGGFGQSEVLGSAKPSDPFHSMDASGALIRTVSQGNVSAVIGDATLAYRAVDPNRGSWTPGLSNAVRSVVMDRANGVTLIYDWATSATPRQWELNFHSPNAFSVNAATVRAANGAASVCLDRHGPAMNFSQTSAWEVAPESSQPAQAHGRYTAQAKSGEFVHLTVLRDSCRTVPVQVNTQGTVVTVMVGGKQVAQFDRRALAIAP